MRNFFLTAARELSHGIQPLPMAGGRNSDLAATLSLTDWFNAYALRLNPQRAQWVALTINMLVDGQPPLHRPAVHVHPMTMRPKSRGRIGLASKDPGAQPLFEANSLGDEEDLDTLRRGVRQYDGANHDDCRSGGRFFTGRCLVDATS